jgi:hypothetical protein
LSACSGAKDLTTAPAFLEKRLTPEWGYLVRKAATSMPTAQGQTSTQGLSSGSKGTWAQVIRSARLSPPPDHQIAASRGALGESQSLVVPMTIANAIILDLAAIDGGRSIQSLQSFKAFRSESGLPKALL